MRNALRSLPKRRDFGLVFREGFSAAAKYLVIYARPNDLEWNRLGLSVSKKIGKAVTRNRVKRLLREAVRKVLRDTEQHYDVVIVAKKTSAEAGLEHFIMDINKLFPRVSNAKSADSTH
jgi:ribonuclease P protein component